MRKLFSLFLVLAFLVAQQTMAQVNRLKYTSPLKFSVGTAITPVQHQSSTAPLATSIYSKAQTIAGNGYYGVKDTLAAFANFEAPLSTAADSKGNIYVADANANCIRKISTTGYVTTFAGSLKAGKVMARILPRDFRTPRALL